MAGSTVAMARPVKPALMCPLPPSANECNSAGIFDNARKTGSTRSASARPAGVSSTFRRERTNNGVPRVVSSCAICRLSAGWAMASVSAALRKCSCRATSRK